MHDQWNVALIKANVFYREAAVVRHAELGQLGLAWESEAVKHIAKISSVGLASTVGALAIERLQSMYWLLPIAAFVVSLIFVLTAMYLASASYFETCDVFNDAINQFDTLRATDEAHALAYAMDNLRTTPKSYFWLGKLARICGWISADAMFVNVFPVRLLWTRHLCSEFAPLNV